MSPDSQRGDAHQSSIGLAVHVALQHSHKLTTPSQVWASRLCDHSFSQASCCCTPLTVKVQLLFGEHENSLTAADAVTIAAATALLLPPASRACSPPERAISVVIPTNTIHRLLRIPAGTCSRQTHQYQTVCWSAILCTCLRLHSAGCFVCTLWQDRPRSARVQGIKPIHCHL